VISILMATYNGGEFLAEQLESLLAQTFDDFVIYVNDDCSTDKTWEILCSYAEKYPNKIKITRRNENSGSAKHTFLELMTRVRDDYVMLCDQDDVWLPDKIEVTLAKMKEMERENSGAVLVYTDLQVVSRDLMIISPSYQDYMHSDFERTAFEQVLIQNVFAGCTGMYNRAMAELLTEIPRYCVAHDWWLLLAASAFGRVTYVDKPTILYRQHGKNEVGARNIRSVLYKLKMILRETHIKKAIHVTYEQANCFLKIYKNRLDAKQIHKLEKYCEIPSMKKLRRLLTIHELGAYKIGFSRNIAYFMFV